MNMKDRMEFIRELAGRDIAVVINCHFKNGAIIMDGTRAHIIDNNVFENTPGPTIGCEWEGTAPVLAACERCYWHIYTGTGGSPWPEAWYLHHCGASGTPVFDPLTGSWEEEYPHCRDVNKDGKCPMFTDKETLR